MTWGMVAVAGAAVVGGAASYAAGSKQASAANHATDVQQAQWDQTQQNLAPYLNLGSSSINPLLQAMGYTTEEDENGNYSIKGTDPTNILQQQFSAPTAAQAQETPGYQFTLGQGLKATQNSAAARGLGTSGAALKGASTYATGLADSTYNDVYNRALQTFNTNYSSAANKVNRLQGLVSNGQNAAATNGSIGAATAGNIGNTLMSGANAQASGLVGASNALSSGVNTYANQQYVSGLINNAGGQGSSVGAAGWSPSTPGNNGPLTV